MKSRQQALVKAKPRPPIFRVPEKCAKCGAYTSVRVCKELADGIASWDIEIVIYTCGRWVFDFDDGTPEELPGPCPRPYVRPNPEGATP